MLSHVAHLVADNPIFDDWACLDAEVDRKHPLATALAAISRQRNFDQPSLDGLDRGDLSDLLSMAGDEDAPNELVTQTGPQKNPLGQGQGSEVRGIPIRFARGDHTKR
jgi:hypothetical protein